MPKVLRVKRYLMGNLLFDLATYNLKACGAQAGLFELGHIHSGTLQLNIAATQTTIGTQAFKAMSALAAYLFYLVFSVFTFHSARILRLTFFIFPPSGGFILEILISADFTSG